VDAIYNPLPNQMHVPWTIKAAEAASMSSAKSLEHDGAEAKTLLAVQERTGVKIGEAFMIAAIRSGGACGSCSTRDGIGELRSVIAAFSYFNRDPNKFAMLSSRGRGLSMTSGVTAFMRRGTRLGGLPKRVVGLIERDPQFGTDRLTSAMLDFPGGHAIFTCSTQLVPYQRVHFLGPGDASRSRSVQCASDRPTRIFIDQTGDILAAES